MTNPSQSDAIARDRLIDIIKARSFQSGVNITLSSGRASTYYFNMKPTMLDPEGSYLIGALTLDLIQDDNAAFIGGLEMGAVPLATSIATVSHAQQRPVSAFFVRKQAKDHGTRSLIEGLPQGEDISGKRVVVVEDVTTTGGSALKAVEVVKESGGEVACVVTIVDRLEGAGASFEEANVPFKALLTLDDFR
ncbi:MAG: orotate phosphoribosyltransferase [Pseudomonadota bacterium]